MLARDGDGIGVGLVDPGLHGVTLTQTLTMGSEADYQVDLEPAPR